MVFAEALTEYLITGLSERIAETESYPFPDTLHADRYLAMSALQKAIRRGNEPVALRAALSLLRGNARGFWRRLGIIAFEDIGVANIDLIGWVTVAMGDNRLRRQLGGDWRVAAFLVSELCGTRKDRAIDNLLLLLLCVEGSSSRGLEILGLPFQARIASAINCTNGLEAQGLAAWSTIGTRRLRLTDLPQTEGCPQSYFDALREAGYPGAAVEIARLGYKRLADPMSPLFPLVYRVATGAEHPASDDPLTAEIMIGGIPSCAIDKHTRPGNAAFRQYLARSARMRDFIAQSREPGQTDKRIIGMLAFRAEGVLEVNRIRWEEGQRLRGAAEIVGIGITPDTVPDGLTIFRDEIDLINQCRAETLASYL